MEVAPAVSYLFTIVQHLVLYILTVPYLRDSGQAWERTVVRKFAAVCHLSYLAGSLRRIE